MTSGPAIRRRGTQSRHDHARVTLVTKTTMTTMTSLTTTAAAVFLLAIGSASALAVPSELQGRQAPQPPAGSAVADRGNEPAVAPTPAEIQRMFEAVALVRAQEVLRLSDERYLPFLARFKALQDVRRRAQQERVRLLRELNHLSGDTTADDAKVKDRLKALQDLDARSEVEIHKAYDGIDQVLDVRQQARFRVFEENMENRRIELMMKARQANRQQNKKP